jgi:uncharacterized protein YgfB (UPF0149 family)
VGRRNGLGGEVVVAASLANFAAEGIEKKSTREDERHTLAERANVAKQLYDRLLKNFQLVELELQQAESERDEALKKLGTITQENLLLLERLRAAEASNVVQFPSKREQRYVRIPAIGHLTWI